jgi:hypothetical protein
LSAAQKASPLTIVRGCCKICHNVTHDFQLKVTRERERVREKERKIESVREEEREIESVREEEREIESVREEERE